MAMSAYHQVELALESRDSTAFITPWGSFRYKRVCFGLASAPAAFQRMMVEMLKGLPGVIIYLDDVLISGATREEHDRRLTAVLERVKRSGLTLNSKCVIAEESIDFVGFTVDAAGIRPCADNRKAIQELKEPSNTTQIKSVLGTAGFYLRCVPEFSDVVEPMRRLLKNNVPFVWAKEQSEAFKRMKNLIAETCPLAIFDPHRETIVATDASDRGLGAVLLQIYPSGERLVSFVSASLTEA